MTSPTAVEFPIYRKIRPRVLNRNRCTQCLRIIRRQNYCVRCVRLARAQAVNQLRLPFVAGVSAK